MTFESHQTIYYVSTALFALAIIHTFLTGYFKEEASRFPEGSIQENLFHALGEVEIVFGFWAALLILAFIFNYGWDQAMQFVDGIHFGEPIFVFSVMTIAASKPIIEVSERAILSITSRFPAYRTVGEYVLVLILGPLLGSFITEPAAMTVTALILLTRFYDKAVSERFKYITIAILFVNVSIGGVLTPYAAPPVIMVAGTWGWDFKFMLMNFGWKAATAITLNSLFAATMLFNELCNIEVQTSTDKKSRSKTPFWIIFAHLCFLVLAVMTAHHPTFCLGVLLFFMGFTDITSEYQDSLKIRQSLLVAFFLAGLVIFGQFQGWWLTPLLHRLNELTLFLGAITLTAFTDNAALTYLGSKVPDVADTFKYALVAGAVTGGGLTVIANAPNPAGFSILQKSFGAGGIQPLKLFFFAILPTCVAAFCFWLL